MSDGWYIALVIISTPFFLLLMAAIANSDTILRNRQKNKERHCTHIYRLYDIEFHDRAENKYHYHCPTCKKAISVSERHRAEFEREFATDWTEYDRTH